jgi:hypothetical protein
MRTSLSLRSPPSTPGSQPCQQALPQAELGWRWQARCSHGKKLRQVLGDALHDFSGEHIRRHARYLLQRESHSHAQLRRVQQAGEVVGYASINDYLFPLRRR